jgi:hypothetical protein
LAAAQPKNPTTAMLRCNNGIGGTGTVKFPEKCVEKKQYYLLLLADTSVSCPSAGTRIRPQASQCP